MKRREKGTPGGRTFSKENRLITGISIKSLEESSEKCLQKPSTPAIPLFPRVTSSIKVKRSRSCFSDNSSIQHDTENVDMASCCNITLRTTVDGQIEASRTQKQKERDTDRLSLDRRGLTVLPILSGESKLRLLSLQHNLLIKLDKVSFSCLPQLVFLDIYNNQLEQISALDCLCNLRVLLLGKNRIKQIDGLNKLDRLEVLDLHGNQITEINGFACQKELKVLNLAGNEIKAIGLNDLKGLCSLQELNLRRNRIKHILGFEETPKLSKLFLSNNEIGTIDSIENLAKLSHLREISLDGNPVTMFKECIFFIASYVPTVQIFGQISLNEDTRKIANLWRVKREQYRETVSSKTDRSDIEKKNKIIKITRVRSASENRISYLRNIRRPVSQYQNHSTSSIDKISQKLPPQSAASSRLTRIRRNNFTKQRTVSCDSGNGSECSMELFRLPPILSPLINNSDDCSIIIRNDTNTSLDSNKSGQSFRCDSLCMDKVIKNSSSSSSVESSSEENEQVPENKCCPALVAVSEIETKLPKDVKKNTKLQSYKTKTVCVKKTKSIACKQTRQNKNASPRQERIQEKGRDYLLEISGRYFNVTGKNSAKFIDRAWNLEKATDITTVRFSCIDFNSLSPVLNKIKLRFSNAEHFTFTDTNINCLGQLNALADIQGLTSLHIVQDGNPISSKRWHNYAIYRLHHWGLRCIDNVSVTERQVEIACEEYKGFGNIVLWSLPDALLTPLLNKLHLEISSNISPKQWLYKADSTLRDVISKEALQWRMPTSLSQKEQQLRDAGHKNLNYIIDSGISAAIKLKMLDDNWHSILRDLVRDTLIDYSNMKLYVKKKITDLRPP